MLGVFFPLLLLLLLPIFDCCIRFRFFSSMTLSASATSHFFFAFSLSVGCSLQGDNRRIVRKSMYGIEVRSNRLIDHVYSSVQANKHIASHTHTHTHNRPQLYHYNGCLCRRFFLLLLLFCRLVISFSSNVRLLFVWLFVIYVRALLPTFIVLLCKRSTSIFFLLVSPRSPSRSRYSMSKYELNAYYFRFRIHKLKHTM